MMRSEHARRRLVVLLMSMLGLGMASAGHAATPAGQASRQPAASSQQFVDGIAAVVNKQVITLKQLNVEVAEAEKNLKAQNIPVPERSILQRQVLQRMILESLQRQEADRLGIRVSDAQVERGVETIAARNGITVDALRKEIAKSGVSWDQYLETLRDEIRFDLLRQREVASSINISDAEVDAFLRTQGRALGAAPRAAGAPATAPQPQAAPRVLGLAQILVAVPERASAQEVAQLQDRAERLLAQLKSGADFAGLAASSSDGPQALEGGVLGVRPLEGWPDLFVEATRGLQVGQVSRIVRSGQGFHILKVLTWGEEARSAPPQQDFTVAGQPPMAQGPMIVTQTRARHILVRTNQITSDEQAEQRLRILRDRLRSGESFEELARRHSDDATAPQGGDLGWLSPGETVPAFEQVMNSLQPGEVSEPFRSPFGWHIVEVMERRNQDMGEEFQRMQARQILFQRKIEPAVDQWLNQLYGQAYVENRLDPQPQRDARRR